MVEPEKPSKNPRKAQIQMDEELAIRLHKEEKAELERMQRERAAQEEASNAALIVEFDNVQARIEADALLACKDFQKKEREISTENKILEKFISLYEREHKWINNFVPMDSEEGGKKAESSKKEAASSLGEEQSVEKEKELLEVELQKLLVVVLVEEVYVEALQVKYPIIDWEVYSEDTRRYWRIIRVGNHTEAYQIFADMLKKFDRDDLVKLWDLVKKRFSTTKPTDDKENELWVELKRLFEPDNDDILWKLQRYMHDPLVWRLYDTCGVHHVSLVRGHCIEEDPRTYNEAMQSQDAAFWKESIDDEIGSIMEKNTRVLCDLPPGCKPLGCKWIFNRKMKVDGTIDEFKARMKQAPKKWHQKFDEAVLFNDYLLS
ncbi:hypothetical protein Tco_0970624 [Tanacetum coccineum]